MLFHHFHRDAIRTIVLSTLLMIPTSSNFSFAAQPDTAQSIANLNSTSFMKVLTNGKYSLIEFGGRRCIPCRQMQPILTALNMNLAASVNIFNVYVDEERDLTRNYRINLIPTQIIFDNRGKELTRHVGYWEKDKLVAELRKLRIVK